MNMPEINKDTKLYLSIAARPGNRGTLVFNRLFRHFGMNAIYKACRVEPGTLREALAGYRALGVDGGGVSMPFKQEAAALMDELDPAARKIGVINTILRLPSGKLRGFNTDYIAALKSLHPDNTAKTMVLGAGGAARAVCYALQKNGFRDVTVVSRKKESARRLAEEYLYRAAEWQKGMAAEGVIQLINATPLGMPGFDQLNPLEGIRNSMKHVVDLPISENNTDFIHEATVNGVHCIPGTRFAFWQALAQFEIYTGQTLDEKTAEEILAEEKA